MDIDPADRVENLHDEKSEKLGRNFHNIGHHPAMVSLKVPSNCISHIALELIDYFSLIGFDGSRSIKRWSFIFAERPR